MTLFFIKLMNLLVFFFSGCVIFSANSVHSAFSLIIVFLGVSAVLISFNLKFIAFVVIILYAGAISILFLFIIFTLNLKEIQQSYDTSLGFTALLNLKIASVLFLSHTEQDQPIFSTEFNLPENFLIGVLMYGKFIPLFLVIGVVLLVAMILIVIIARPFINQ